MAKKIDWEKHLHQFTPGRPAPEIAGAIGCSVESVYEYGRQNGFTFEGRTNQRFANNRADYLSVLNEAKERTGLSKPNTMDEFLRLQAEMERVEEERFPNEGLTDMKQRENYPDNFIYNDW